MLRVGVLVSGNGTNLQALLDASSRDLPARVVVVACNRSDAPALKRAAAFNVPTCVVDRGAIPGRSQRQQHILQALQGEQVELVVLAGYDEILQPAFLTMYDGRIINTHPSLLPAFGGSMRAVQQALEYGVKVTGCTVHLVTSDVDAGPILLQRCVEVQDGDNVATLHARILAQEHLLLVEAVRAWAEGRIRVEGRRGRVLASR
ncbi:MAG: phosphoribosylglycinamide formyltransferase [Chloroflexi bacterium]|nr:phosphoribosylglycinamide formyltransferase [Chloroflexota bacterium]